MNKFKIKKKGNGHSIKCNDVELNKITEKIEVIIDPTTGINQVVLYIHFDDIEMDNECKIIPALKEIISEQGYNRLKLLVDTLREKYEK